MTAIVSAFLAVLKRWATMTVVRFVMTLSRASCTILSDSVSKALVASSSSRILGSLRIALAMAILCFCPSESCVACSPTEVAKPWGMPTKLLDIQIYYTKASASFRKKKASASLISVLLYVVVKIAN
jgi:hypothetical protein